MGYITLIICLSLIILLFCDLKDFEMESVSEIMKGEDSTTKFGKALMYLLVIFWAYPSQIVLLILKKLFIK